MVGFSTENMTVTTWGDGNGPDAPQRWRARTDDGWWYFYCPRGASATTILDAARTQRPAVINVGE